MAFYTSREINLTLNGRAFFANSMSLSQEASLTNPFLEGDLVSKDHVSNAPVNSSLKINYYLTGADYLKDFILLNHRKNITGNIGGIQFSNGYLESYSLAAEPNSPISVSASIKICDEVVGSFSSSAPSHFPQNFSVWNFNDAYINPFPNYSAATISNITRFNWDYSADVSPVYYANQTGLSKIDADRVVIGEKNISCSISCDNTQIPLRFTGEQYAVELVCRSPNRLSSETYGISGRISKKTFGTSANSIAESVYSVSQSHVNEEPRIESIDTSTYVGSNTVSITSKVYPNKFTTTNEGFSTVVRVTLGDRDLSYTMTNGATNVITATPPVDAINGYLTVETTKGVVQYPSPVSLTFPAITVTGFTPITGAEHCLISILGLNFHRISDVRINNKSCIFDVVDTTGTLHRINAYVPNSPTIGKVSVHSILRNVSGFSTGNFYPAMEITSFNPATGTWSGVCTLSGKNFTGITNVYFNGIRSPNFTVNNNQQITARIPMTGQGFTKGYLSVSGFQGGVARSRTIYQPILKITGINILTGRPDNDIVLSGLFDSGFLYFESGGYRVAFGDEYSIFMRSGNVAGAGGSNFILTGYVPLGNFGSAAPAMIEPDGVTRYDKFTGQYLKIGKPVINSVNGMSESIVNQFSLFNRYSLVLQGENLNYLFGTPYSVILSGDGFTNGDAPTSTKNIISTHTNSDVDYSAGDGTTITVKNIRATGNPFREDLWCKIGVVNLAGTGWFPHWLKFVNFNISEDPLYSESLSMVRLPRTATNSMDTTLYLYGKSDGAQNPDICKANNIIATNVSQYASSYTRRFVANGSDITAGLIQMGITMDSGWIDYVFDPVINFGGLYVEQASDMPTTDAPLGGWKIRNSSYSPYLGAGGYQNTQTGQILCYHLPPPAGSARLAFRTGVIFSTSASNGLTTVLHNNNVVTGVKNIRLFRNASGEPNNVAGFIGLSHILFFD